MRLLEIETPNNLPPGRTFRCRECGTLLRSGQPHSALLPRPHQSFDALIHTETLEDARKAAKRAERAAYIDALVADAEANLDARYDAALLEDADRETAQNLTAYLAPPQPVESLLTEEVPA